MKVVGVVSSSNAHGNSAALLREALAGARECGAETEEVFLPGLTLGFCTGCLRCLSAGACVQNDDFMKLRKTLLEADGIVLSTPVYAGAPGARLKNLIDRLGLFEYMTSAVFGGKYFASVATAKSSGAKETVRYLTRVAEGGIFGAANVTGSLPAVLRGGKTAADRPDLLRAARTLGRKLADDCFAKRTYPGRNAVNRFIMNTFVRPMLAKSIVEYRDKGMEGVYSCLKNLGRIA